MATPTAPPSDGTSRRIVLAALAALAVAALAAALLPRPLPAVPPRPTFTGDAAVVERFQCYRCHQAPGRLVPAAREASCVDCHRAILAGDFDSSYARGDVERWRSHLTSLLAAPSLDGIGRRFERAWFVSFLQAPSDLRPHLPASMPRFRMSASDAEAIARHFGLEDHPAEPPTGDAERGRQRYLAVGCARCHAFRGSGVEGPAAAVDEAARLAPDLRVTRERMRASAVVAWLGGPRAIDRASRMPDLGLAEGDRADLAAFVLSAPLASPAAEPPFERLPLLARRVTHAEVDAAVFHRTCRHCHADPVPVGGDGGPGNTGGLGFAGRGFDLSTYAAIDRARGELLAADPSGLPLLVGALVRRHDEVRGRPGDRRGMPLGLPPVSPEALQLVETWVAQGAPRDLAEAQLS